MAGHETMIEVLYLYLLPHHFAIVKVILILLEHSKSLIVARMDESLLRMPSSVKKSSFGVILCVRSGTMMKPMM